MAGVRFYRRGKTRVFFVPTIANQAAPTAAEIAAGTELSAKVADIAGFSSSLDRIDAPDMSSNFTPTVPGEAKVADSSLQIYLESISNPLRATLAQNTTGFIVFCDYKPSGALAAADVVDVYPVTVGSIPKERSMSSTPAKWTAEFGISAVPSEDVAVV